MRINPNWGQAELPGVLSPSHLAGLLHGAGRGDPLILLISRALGEAGSELAGVAVGNRAARESAGSSSLCLPPWQESGERTSVCHRNVCI